MSKPDVGHPSPHRQDAARPSPDPIRPPDPLRVALVAGSLGQGGAEKQLFYLARALQQAGVQVSIYSLTRGEYYEARLEALGLKPVWIGRLPTPLVRSAVLARLLAANPPHILQSTHNFTNLHAAIAAGLGAAGPGAGPHGPPTRTPNPWASPRLSIGSIRSDPLWSRKTGEFWSPWLWRLPTALIANSNLARSRAVAAGVPPGKVHVLPNGIDLPDFDRQAAGLTDAAASLRPEPPALVVAAVSRLIPVKRLDIFLKALALSRAALSRAPLSRGPLAGQAAPTVQGLIVGEGSQRSALENLAGELGLLPGGVRFLGQREDVPAVLSQADLLLLTSEYEGFPNVLLEAMASRLPVITTPAGDAGLVVQDGVTGYVVSASDRDGAAAEIAGRIVQLAGAPGLRSQMGAAGRRRVEQHYSSAGLAARLFSIYHAIAQTRRDRRLLEIIPPILG